VVLPFDRGDFVRTSVAAGGAEWVARFDAALARATRVIFATEEGYLGDDILFRQAAYLVEGLAVLRAAQLETTPSLLAVFDAEAAGGVGGTRDAVERWRIGPGSVQTVDLAALREGAPAARDDGSGLALVSALPSIGAGADGSGPASRVLKAMVFADFAGYSRISDANVARFQQAFWSIAGQAIAAADVAPDFANTWGDGLYLVFDVPRDAAAFALRLRDAMHATDWRAFGLPDGSQIRIGLNAGPVFRGFDPVIGRDNYYGASVTRAARIEPVTPPGTVFASEAFAATLAATGGDRFLLEYVGRVGLAKSYGEARVYRVDRR
jgi:class 3 adenylate cyclase